MGANYAQAVANGQTNLWGDELVFMEPESEHSSASAAEGFALAGGRVTNFTSGQGLILMKEVLYVISGKRLPVVFHIGARALTSHSLNVHAGHDDVMGVADTGWGMVFAKNAQDAGDLALISRRAAEDSQTPFLNVQDGFLTTHTIENVVLPELELMKEYVGAPDEKLLNLFDTANPIQSGVVQNQDSYMKGKIAQRYFYDQVKPALINAMDEYYELTGRRYNLIESYRMDDADYALVCLGTMAETAEVTCDYMRAEMGIKVGVVHVTSFRPFPGPELVEALAGTKAFAVVERMDNPMGQSNPLTSEVKSAFADAMMGEAGYPAISRIPTIYSGAAGLGSRDVRAGDFIATVKNMQEGGERFFVLGIDHELTLPNDFDPDVRPAGAFSMRGHSVGGFGSVTTNKVIATIVGDLFDLYVQAFPKYGSEKKGLPTTYYLTAAEEKIRSHAELKFVEFVPLNDVNAFNLGNPLRGLQDGGTMFMQSRHEDPQDVWASIPSYAKRVIRRRNIRVLYLDAAAIARDVASEPDLQVRMQGIVLLGVFLKSTPFLKARNISDEQLMAGVEKSLRKYFGKRGERVVQDNVNAVNRGFSEVMEIPAEVIQTEGQEADLEEVEVEQIPVSSTPISLHLDIPEYIKTFNETVIPAYNNGQDEALVAGVDVARSLVPAATGGFRDFSYIAPEIPEFYNDKCVGCMTCVTECPDTAILGKVVDPAVLETSLASSNGHRAWLTEQWTETNKFFKVPEKKNPGSGGLFGIFIDPTKCKGCAECVEVCHDLGYDALGMIEKEEDTVPKFKAGFDFYQNLPATPDRFINERVLVDMMLSDKSLGYVGGAGSCAGCGEATALRMWMAGTAFQYGQDNIGIVNATGCTTVYGSTYPYNPWAVPWTNSLFENAATDAMGVRARWDQMGWGDKRLWVLGGDGAMIDIGFASLSRMLASGMDIKVLVLDTQVYSNTGGQASTATFTGQGAKMSPFGKEVLGKQERRKELAQIAMMHPDVYVAQTTAAHINHFYRAIMEANAYPGPAVISVYTTCQPEHGVGDQESQQRAREAVDSRAFPLLVYDPRKGETIRERLSLKGNPNMKADWYVNPKTKEPFTFIDFARGEGRFAKNFDKDGNPTSVLAGAERDRLLNWRMLQDLAGLL